MADKLTTAMVLAAGLGKRMRPLTADRPKPLVPVLGRTLLDRVLDRLAEGGVEQAVVNVHYLGEQIDAFGGSYILTFIAYNAGPRKVPEWIERYGDPRGKSIDEVVDWIERIPFPETRNYVMRVMENYQVYKSRLGQKTDIVHDLRFGR